MKRYRVCLTRAAEKELDSLPTKIADRILDVIRQLATDPRPKGSKKLAGSANAHRIRISDYRVIYEVHDKEVLVMVIRVSHRKDAYR